MRSLLALAAVLLGTGSAMAEVPKVVASIKPVHALVAAVMGDLGTPDLLVKGAASPHAYSLRPSDAGALQQADIVFWAGHQFEVFLEDKLSTLAPNARSVTLGDAPDITLLPARESGTFEHHDHEAEGEAGHDHADHAADAHADEVHADDAGHDHADHGELDMHTFLDPENAKAMVRLIEKTLSDADPEHATIYAENAAAERVALDELVAEVDGILEPVRDRPIVVFHDAYQYFQKRFGVNIVGSVTVSPENMPGADRIAEVRAKLKTLDAACVFAEPNFDDRIVNVLVEGTNARTGTLDPEGATLAEGPDLYPNLIRGIAQNMADCLAR